MKNANDYDVIILGSSLSGSMMAAILARHGLRVVMLEKHEHPRFAIGEATTPDMGFAFKMLAAKYDVPEIESLSCFHKLRDEVSPACGVKRSFSFLYHREGSEQLPEESHQYPTLSAPMGPDCHLFRQDTDAFLFTTALRYGADARQRTVAAEIDVTEDGVRIETDKGDTLVGRYLVDASGAPAPLAKKFDLRDNPDRFRTNSRGIFTHMVGVKHYDQVGRHHEEYGLKFPLSQGTLHHVFEGGWFWVIPFNNHVDAVNPLCSVGLLLNRERYPEEGRDPEEEFFSFVNRFPTLSKQFEGAKAVRSWVSSGRIQYVSKKMTGRRYCLMPNTAAFIDPLFSSGINLTLAGVDMLADRILHACENDDFSEGAFEDVDEFFEGALEHYDQVIANSFFAFRDFDLWDAWFRVWVAGLLVSTALNANLYLRYVETGDKAFLKMKNERPFNSVLGYGLEEQRALFDEAHAQMEQVRSNGLEPSQAAANIRALFERTSYVPGYFRWHESSVRATPAFTLWGMTRMYFWYLFRSPRRIRQNLFGWRPMTAYAYIFRAIRSHSKLSRRRSRFFIRDVFRAWNTDWGVRSPPAANSGRPQ